MTGTGWTGGTGRTGWTGAGTGSGMLRRLLRAFEEAAPGEGLAQIADRLGIDRAEAADLAAYWVRKGRLRREEIGTPDCSGCFFASRGCATTCPDGSAGSSRPALVALTPVPRGEGSGRPAPQLPGSVAPYAVRTHPNALTRAGEVRRTDRPPGPP